jgi:hypothetical protein
MRRDDAATDYGKSQLLLQKARLNSRQINGFSLLEEKEEPEHFGNAFAKFGSPSILLRIAKDRGDILVKYRKERIGDGALA